MLNDFTQQIITEFRANQGRVGGPFDGARLLLLTTTGARSGRPHTAVLGYYPDTEDRLLVVGSAGGGPKHPDWFHNLRADPRVTVETGVFTYEAEATVLQGAERDETFARLAEADPGWAEYQRRTTRTIPVVALTQVAGGPPNASSFGEALILIHAAFRRELALIRKEVATSAASGSVGLGAQLRINCLTLCRGLHFHHTVESDGLFPSLLDRYPELTDTISALQADHDKIALLLEEFQLLLSTGSPAAILPEIDRLIEELTDHLDREEAQLIPLM
ncbi:Hemerythrin HHE cation binding domain protein [Kribbella flavida DSM 17836]|uniref:Hemerythrin HHE cation binding domain protein n=1 Tax=Kribbella flavida (strain DSM 17836 / JCM 10339 / NBRC 14399) TaxID=479435 RepID=D2PUH8_KRIFD|nr:nitroreductase/quinone reductase family protein [Kribbella flavida]ADB29496.1 Hemerythrin HHE cation binding domain protein [Kribbella flavida DSM 17836]